MSHELRLYIFIAVLTIIAVIVLFFYSKGLQKDRLKIAQLKDKYNEALRRKDKQKALELGGKYYSALRSGNLTIYNEQAIANDLSSIT